MPPATALPQMWRKRSAMNSANWLPEPQVFVERNQQRLRTIPVAFFAVGLTVTEKDPEILRKAEASMDSVRTLVSPVEVGVFPGRLESNGLSFADRTIIKLIRAKTGDFRDWEAVRSWAQAVHSKIAPA